MHRADIDLRRLGLTAAGLCLLVLAAIAAVLLLLGHWRTPAGGPPADPAQVLAVPAPRLQSAPQDELAAYRAAQQKKLDSAGWVDRQAGTVHIPIADALELVAAGQAPKVAAPASAPTPARPAR